MPVAGPVPPPIIVVTPDISASSICCGQMKVDVRVDAAGGHDHALAGDDLGARRRSRWSTPGWMSGLPALPMPAMRPSLMPMSALTMPQWSTISALVMTVSATSAAHALALAHAVADHLAAAELHFLAVDGEVLLDLDQQLGVGQAHAVAGGGAEHLGIGLPADFDGFHASMLLSLISLFAHRAVTQTLYQRPCFWCGSVFRTKNRVNL